MPPLPLANRRPVLPRAWRLEPLEDRCLLSGDVVIQWTNLLLDAARARGQGTQVTARNVAILEAAVYDSVNAVDRGHAVYHVNAQPPAGTSAEAAAAQAAHDVAVSLYNRAAEIALFDQTLAANLAAIPDGQPEDDGIALGRFVAGEILAWRRTDGANAVVPYTPGSDPGDWQPTPPTFGNAVTPQWPYVTPFAMTTGSQFRPGPPPALTSADYTEAFQEVKALGGNGTTTPSERTPEQTEIARYWAQGSGTSTPVGYWNHVAETVAAAAGNSLAENARLFALLNVTMADSGIATFDAKYAYNFWRPVTAIRAADTDGNPDTSADPAWTPLLVTPLHPSYVAFHACISESAAQALATFFGTDHVSFTATSESLPGVKRSYQKFTEASHEAGVSRIYGGIHWRFDVTAGRKMGRELGEYVAANYFLPVTVSAGEAPAKGGPEKPGNPGSQGGVAIDLASRGVEAQTGALLPHSREVAGLLSAGGPGRLSSAAVAVVVSPGQLVAPPLEGAGGSWTTEGPRRTPIVIGAAMRQRSTAALDRAFTGREGSLPLDSVGEDLGGGLDR